MTSKQRYEGQKDWFKSLYEEIGTKPNMAYTLYHAASTLEASNAIDVNDPQHIQTFLTDAVEMTTKDFLERLNRVEPIASSPISSVLPMSANPMYHYDGSIQQFQQDTLSFHDPSEHYLIQIQLASVSTFLKNVRADLMAYQQSAVAAVAVQPEVEYLIQSQARYALDQVAALNAEWKTGHEEGLLEWGEVTGELISFVATAAAEDPRRFLDTLTAAVTAMEQIVHAQWEKALTTVPQKWLDTYAEEEYYPAFATIPIVSA